MLWWSHKNRSRGSAVTVRAEGRGVNAARGGGIPPPYSTAENNNHIITQYPKHLLGKHSLERS